MMKFKAKDKEGSNGAEGSKERKNSKEDKDAMMKADKKSKKTKRKDEGTSSRRDSSEREDSSSSPSPHSTLSPVSAAVASQNSTSRPSSPINLTEGVSSNTATGSGRVRKKSSVLDSLDSGGAMGFLEFFDDLPEPPPKPSVSVQTNTSPALSKASKKEKKSKSNRNLGPPMSVFSKSDPNLISRVPPGELAFTKSHSGNSVLPAKKDPKSDKDTANGVKENTAIATSGSNGNLAATGSNGYITTNSTVSSYNSSEPASPSVKRRSGKKGGKSWGEETEGSDTEYHPKEKEEMRQIFPEVANETLLSYYTSKQSKFFLTPNYLCYLTPDDTKCLIPLRDIIYLGKKSSLIEMISLKGNFTFSSLPSNLFKSLESALKTFLPASTSLSTAIKNEDAAKVELLLNHSDKIPISLDNKDEDSCIPLHAGAKSGSVTIVEALLGYYRKLNLDINVKDSYGWTLVHFATYYTTGKPSDDDILKKIVEYPNVVVDVASIDGNTPLHYFCQKFLSPSCQELGELLIKKGALVNKQNKNGETPLHKAIFNSSVRLLMLELLIAHGADVNIPTIHKEIALHYAVRLGRKDIIKLLLNAGADFTMKSGKQNMNPYELALDNRQVKIAEMIKRASDLKEWLASLQLEQFYQTFLKEELFLDILIENIDSEKMAESMIESLKLGLTMGSRLTLKKAIMNLKHKAAQQQAQQAPSPGVGRPLDRSGSVPIGSSSGTGSSDGQDFKKRLQKVKDSSRVAPSPTLNAKRVERIKIAVGLQQNAWLINHDQLEFTKKLGSGTSGKVYKGLYRGEKVAIKVLKTEDPSVEEEFKKEFNVMSVIDSPHIVHFIGACLEPKLCMVMEYCGLGSLFHVLNDKGLDIGWDLALKFAIEIAAGLNCLHTWQPPIVHRDMKSLNILVNDAWEVKLTDFGLARFNTTDNLRTLANIVGTVGWTAPELLSGSKFTAKSDVYSLAIILWEIVVRVIKGSYEQPYRDQQLSDLQIMIQTSEHQVRPPIPPTCFPALSMLIKECWDPVPDKRPNCLEIERQLEEIHRNFKENTEEWNRSILHKSGSKSVNNNNLIK